MIRVGPRKLAARLLVVEDDPDIGSILVHILEREGLRVDLARTGEEALRQAKAQSPDLVLLDVMLPDFSGLEVLKFCKQSPETARTRFIIISAKKDELDRVLGFELGADDYVTKPFSPRELVLRVRAVLQRGQEAAGTEDEEEERLQAGPIEIDLAGHRVTVSNRPVHLTLTEFRLLEDLVRAGGRVRTREALLAEVWGYDSDVMSRTVDTHIRRLRKKLGGAAAWLATVQGVGYRVRNPEADGRAERARE